jgi:lipopolysaccharide export LptBFGC system permease protein LptF
MALNSNHPFTQTTNQQTLNKPFINNEANENNDKTLQALKRNASTGNYTSDAENAENTISEFNRSHLQPSAFAKQQMAEKIEQASYNKSNNPYARTKKTNASAENSGETPEKNNHNYVYWLFLPLCVACMSIIAWLASKDSHQDDWH